jgi:hypothetical protein
VIRKIAQFVFWRHLKATTWTSGIVVVIAALNQFGLFYPILRSSFHVGMQAYQPIDAVLGPVGLLALGAYLVSLLLNRRRRADPTFGNDRHVED